ncbi:MAG: hypothetical protein GY870_06655 [archaeon]|nr:hypothetical protein [archaeon]
MKEKFKIDYDKNSNILNLDWNKIEKELDITLDSINNINNEDIEWLVDLLNENIEITFEKLINYYIKDFVYYVEILGLTIIEEKYEISSKIKTILEYNKQEIIDEATKNIEEEDFEEFIDTIEMLEEIKIQTIKRVVNILNDNDQQ